MSLPGGSSGREEAVKELGLLVGFEKFGVGAKRLNDVETHRLHQVHVRLGFDENYIGNLHVISESASGVADCFRDFGASELSHDWTGEVSKKENAVRVPVKELLFRVWAKGKFYVVVVPGEGLVVFLEKYYLPAVSVSKNREHFENTVLIPVNSTLLIIPVVYYR